MTFLAFQGALATAVFAAVIFVEESGVPLFVISGDVLLISGGILITTGAISPWAFVPTAIAASIGGGLLGYTWARTLGERRLRAFAARIRLDRRFDSVRQRIQSAGPAHIALVRLIVPGMRVNSSLLAGALGVPRRTFLMALVPSTVAWVAVFTTLGALVGLPVEHFLVTARHTLIPGIELAAVGLVAYLAARYAPIRGAGALQAAPARARLALAAITDLATIATAVAGFDLIVRDVLAQEGIDDVLDLSITAGVTVLLYFLATRGIAGRTAGEALLGVSYRAAGASGDG